MESRARLVFGIAVLVATAMLAVPSVVAAHQTVTIDPGPGGRKTLHIVGDVTKKTDTVSITYDSVKDEYVITHDVVSLPAGCTTVGAGPPFKEIHCPAKGITDILIETGTANDIVKTANIRLTTALNFVDPKLALFFPPDLFTMEIKVGTGNDSYVDQPALPATATTTNPAALSVDMGGGNDSATVPGGGPNTFIFGDGNGRLTTGDGDNIATFGAGNANATLGNGDNRVTVGDGNSRVYVGTGDNIVVFGAGNSSFGVGVTPLAPRLLDASVAGSDTVTFGTGNSVYSGGDGSDTALFAGEGKSTFTGGGGNDAATLGGSNDTASGGPGDDVLRGGTGEDTLRGARGKDSLLGGAANDRLFGGPDFDLLKGGAGRRDACFGGGPGILLGCERP